MSLPNNSQQLTNSQASPKNKKEHKRKKLLPLSSSNTANRQNFIRSPCSPLSTTQQVMESDIENRTPENDDTVSTDMLPESEKETPSKNEEAGNVASKENSSGYRRSSSVKMEKMQKMFQNAAEENVRSIRAIRAYVTGLKERVAKLQYQKQLLVCQVLELEANGHNIEDEGYTDEPEEPQVSWQIIFKEQRQMILELWHVCYVSIIHRTQFYLLLFKGDPADQIYMVAKLVGFCTGGNMSKEMFELNFVLPSDKRPWLLLGLNQITNLLNL